MKKILLLSVLLSTIYFASAQSTGNPNVIRTSSVCNVVPIGNSPNAFGAAGGNKRQLSYNKDINTVAFIHRMECDTVAVGNKGHYSYDVSFNGGTSWNINQPDIYGPVASPCILGDPHPARYPKGMIFNQQGNTNPSNGHLAYAGIWNGIPGGKVNGTGHFDLSPPNENYDSLSSGNVVWVEDIFTTKTDQAWIVGKLTSQFGGVYEDTITIFKGTWNGSNFIYNYYPVRYLVNPDVGIRDMKIAFSDNGQIGYIAIITNQDPGHTHFINSSAYIQVLKTTDGGNAWSCPTDIDVQEALDSALINQGNIYETDFNIDIVIDANDNLHIVAHIWEYSSFGFPLTIDYGKHGIFDIYTTDGGDTYFGQLLAHPQTVTGQFGTAGIDQITEFLRQFANRTWDGTKLFFGFFDTDTATFAIGLNLNPDLRLIGYDVTNDTWTADLSNLQTIDGGENITSGTNSDGACTFGSGSYYSKDNGGIYSVPVSYMVLASTPSDPCNHFYIDCAAPSGSFIYNGHPLSIPVYHLSTLCDGGDGVVLSSEELSKELIVSSNYPNPFTGKTSVDVTLAKEGDVTIEIRNVVGQILTTSTYLNLHSGKNTITLDASTHSQGLYFFTVKSGSNSVTKRMIVE